MRIYTRSGDDGTTGVFGGGRVSKTDPVIDALGSLDELNAALGLAQLHAKETDLAELLAWLQNALFDLGAELATPKDSPYYKESLQPADTRRLEESIDRLSGELPELRTFILPGGTHLAAHLHVARTVCRRAERAMLLMSQTAHVGSEPLRFVNRLSDWLFTAARFANHIQSQPDITWHPRS